MGHPKSLIVLLGLTFLLPFNLFAQERGWGDTWTQPGSEGERALKERTAQIKREVSEKKYGDAEKDLDALIRHSPENPGLRILAAAAHAAMRRYDAALQDFGEGLRLVKKYAPAAEGEILNGRALIYSMMGNGAASRADFERALRLNRGNAEFNNNFAWLLATSPDASIRDGKLALHYANTAAELGNYRDASTLDTLAAAEAEAGDFAAAAKYERSALSLSKDKKLRGGDKRLQLYESHQPFRQTLNPNRLFAE